MRHFIVTAIALLTVGTELAAQTESDSAGAHRIEREAEKTVTEPSEKSPRKAMLLSTCLPGSGQFYNEKYWKIPIVYGGIAAGIYFARFNRSEYIRYRDAYRIETDDNPDTQSEFANQNITPAGIKERRDHHRKFMELSYISIGAVYLLQIVDAYVDAHLFDFDVSDDLSLRATPDVFAGGPAGNGAGVRLTFHFHSIKR